mmetsp:Transcript_20637/g.52122  ORF Transcript_20637/g.52122 Transcript_20637/m.52122 type:complete len:214 (+) Transcript_20637:3501-4142(+)|eukprot:CAMPEP_0178995976 /NCGR_PEP_ID=MMETSP0795-20121207/8111_1 /TAXON_ID=88552 /ORGANISM="Amoebophrya sp., Strain Ameob2" /LENGTH=213 /DNA_ID=CAMNT_0020688313 /DNA_START=197 /DNA_END=838 /DNA_ORIENTATION=+
MSDGAEGPPPRRTFLGIPLAAAETRTYFERQRLDERDGAQAKELLTDIRREEQWKADQSQKRANDLIEQESKRRRVADEEKKLLKEKSEAETDADRLALQKAMQEFDERVKRRKQNEEAANEADEKTAATRREEIAKELHKKTDHEQRVAACSTGLTGIEKAPKTPSAPLSPVVQSDEENREETNTAMEVQQLQPQASDAEPDLLYTCLGVRK